MKNLRGGFQTRISSFLRVSTWASDLAANQNGILRIHRRQSKKVSLRQWKATK